MHELHLGTALALLRRGLIIIRAQYNKRLLAFPRHLSRRARAKLPKILCIDKKVPALTFDTEDRLLDRLACLKGCNISPPEPRKTEHHDDQVLQGFDKMPFLHVHTERERHEGQMT